MSAPSLLGSKHIDKRFGYEFFLPDVSLPDGAILKIARRFGKGNKFLALSCKNISEYGVPLSPFSSMDPADVLDHLLSTQ